MSPTAPPPENFSASPGETSVNLSWDAVTDAEKYQVQRLNGIWQDHVERTQLSYEDMGLVCNKTYSYRVKTRGDGDPYSTDYGAASSEASATTTAVCPDAPAPDNLSATIDADETSVTLTWDQVPDSARYKVQQLSSGSWVIRAHKDPMETTYTYTPAGGLSCGTTYTFRVSTRGDGSPWSINYGNTTEASAPTSACPPNVSVTSSTLTTVSLAWGDVDYATRYLIERCCDLSPPFGWGTAGTVDDTGAATQTYTDRGLSCSTSYSFRVSTQGDGTNTASGYGNPSTTVPSATDACEPTVRISGLASEIPIGSSDTFDVVMTHLDTATDYLLTLYTSNTDLGFDSSCTTTQQSVSLTNLTSSTETQSFVVHSCNAGTGVLTVILSGGGFTKNDSASVTPPTLDAPSGLTITPLPLRKALLRWDAVVQSGATVTYIVQVQKVGGTWDSDISMTVPEHRFDLEAVASDLGLDDEEAFRFQVKAQDSTGAYLDSAWSTVTIRDSPLLQSLGRAYGESTDNITSGGKAVLQWEEISAVQGYEIRYRKLGHYENKHHSIGSEWLADINVYPENHAYETANVMVTAPSLGVSSATITRLIPRELYAIQLNYQTSTGEWVFSARDVFVWPSNSRPGQDDDFPGQGDRVAGFPYFGHWPDAEYAPVICQNTFPETERSAWVALIKHATEQWEVATTSVLPSPHPLLIARILTRLAPWTF